MPSPHRPATRRLLARVALGDLQAASALLRAHQRDADPRLLIAMIEAADTPPNDVAQRPLARRGEGLLLARALAIILGDAGASLLRYLTRHDQLEPQARALLAWARGPGDDAGLLDCLRPLWRAELALGRLPRGWLTPNQSMALQALDVALHHGVAPALLWDALLDGLSVPWLLERAHPNLELACLALRTGRLPAPPASPFIALTLPYLEARRERFAPARAAIASAQREHGLDDPLRARWLDTRRCHGPLHAPDGFHCVSLLRSPDAEALPAADAAQARALLAQLTLHERLHVASGLLRDEALLTELLEDVLLHHAWPEVALRALLLLRRFVPAMPRLTACLRLGLRSPFSVVRVHALRCLLRAPDAEALTEALRVAARDPTPAVQAQVHKCHAVLRRLVEDDAPRPEVR